MKTLAMALLAAAGLVCTLPMQERVRAVESRASDSRPAGGSSLSGVVLWKSNSPEKDDAACVVGPGGRLANAVVTLLPLDGQDLSAMPPPQLPVREQAETRPAEEGGGEGRALAFKDGEFGPRILVIRPGEPVALDTRDGALDRFDGSLDGRQLFMIHGRGKFDLGKMIRGPGPVQINGGGGAAIAWIFITEEVHRITGPSGSFRFEGVPPGRYRLDVWHERGGKKTQEVLLEAGRPLRIELELRWTGAPSRPR